MAGSKDDFPWRQLGVLSICRLAEPVAFCSITAYAFIMVQEIKGEQDASFYAGLLVSVFAAAEACTAWFWGELSDKYGRKPIILVALLGTALSSFIFGFAKNYWVALVARIIGGALNGNVAVMQTMVAEMVTRPEHEPKAYALQPFMWSLGAIAGSALGGFTAQPARFYPHLFSSDGVFGKFPYLLPNLISVGVIMTAFVLGYLLLEETNPALQEKKVGQARANGTQPTIETTPLMRERRASVMSKSTMRSERYPPSYIAIQAPLAMDPSFDLRRTSIASITSATLFRRPSQTLRAQDVSESTVFEDEADDDAPRVSIFTKGVIAWTIALWLLCYHQMAFASILPVYLLDDPLRPPHQLDLVGGLGQTLPQVGTILAVQSIISLVVQGAIFPGFVQWLGVYAATVSLVIVTPLVYLITPLVSVMPNVKAGVYIVLTLQSLTSVMVYPTILILLKNACPSPSVLGRINGIAMSGCSASRTLAPPLVGILYSGIGSAAAWWSCAVVAVIGLVEVLCIPRPASTEKLLEEDRRRA